MQTQTAIKLAGSATALAEILGITPPAISQWGDTLPELRFYKLRELKPEWFAAQTNSAQPAPEKVAVVIASELPVSRGELVEAIKADIVKDPRQAVRRAADRRS